MVDRKVARPCACYKERWRRRRRRRWWERRETPKGVALLDQNGKVDAPSRGIRQQVLQEKLTNPDLVRACACACVVAQGKSEAAKGSVTSETLEANAASAALREERASDGSASIAAMIAWFVFQSFWSALYST